MRKLPYGNLLYSKQQYTYSIKSAGAVSSTRFILHSDERIKKDIVDVEDDEALVKLRKLHPKKYRYIDESAQGAHQVYGFLANEVQEVLPDAVVEHTNEIPSIYQFANATSSNVITFSGDFDTSQLESNVLVVVGVDQVKHELTVDEIIDSTSVRVVEDLSAFSGSLDEHGNVVTETQTLSITPEEYDELEDKDGFKPISDESNVITEYTKTTTTYVGDQLFVYGEVVDDFKHLQESAISTLSTSALQEVDRQLQAEKARNDTLESRIEALEAQLASS
jgi:BMFP domain-containing protein YqiC